MNKIVHNDSARLKVEGNVAHSEHIVNMMTDLWMSESATACATVCKLTVYGVTAELQEVGL